MRWTNLQKTDPRFLKKDEPEPFARVEAAIQFWYEKAVQTGDWSAHEYWRGYLDGARDQKRFDEAIKGKETDDVCA